MNTNTDKPKVTTLLSAQTTELSAVNKTTHRPSLECSDEKTCRGRCTNTTEWRTEEKFVCYCDPDCYELFYDCCSDYIKFCGFQRPKRIIEKNLAWECIELGNKNVEQSKISDGIWMVTHCATSWPQDEIRQRCENSDFNWKTLFDVYQAAPVVSKENITFRNVHCALCNDAADSYDTWTFYADTEIIPPEGFNHSVI
jgi:hypothetical protein